MKRMALFLLGVCSPVFGGVVDDGYLMAGEHDWFITWRSYDPPLIVDGGGQEKFQSETMAA